MSERQESRSPTLVRTDITRRKREGSFIFPYGVYPEKSAPQEEGYDAKYLEDEGCFYYQVIVSHEKILDTFLALARLLPEQGRLVTKVHSEDFYQDHDTYLSDDSLAREELFSWLRKWRDVVVDDGFFGVGFFSDEGGAEVFLDEHKTIHVYYQDADAIEKLLDSIAIPFKFGLKLFWDEPHYHEALPLESDGVDYLNAFEDLADTYNLYLEEEEDEHLDHAGDPIGLTCWKIEVRGFAPVTLMNKTAKGFYSTFYVNGGSRREVVDLIEERLMMWEESLDLVLQMARVPAELLREEMRKQNQTPDTPGVWFETERIFFDTGPK